ncbi:NUDIX domain-containing protein [Bacillus salitolerans]|uniref:NUDIX domain-containing protein n=1 Tax=Bacillus salitolerans TaxID=1437434 RepID=A0ABW4LRW3_9BACI
MKWSSIPYLWQQAYEVAWESFLEGARPIGALVVNDVGEIVSRGKSSVFKETSDSVVFHNELAHAEVNALLKIDNRVHKYVKGFTLYSTLEPCPLCFSAFYMSGIRNLKYGAKDKYGGSTNLKDTTPYLSLKPITIEGPICHLENLSILLQYYYDYSIQYVKAHSVHDAMAEEYPRAIQLAKQWVEEKKLKDPHHYTIEHVYEMMREDLVQLNRPRACGAIILDDHILMVKIQHGDRIFWTLPGGGLEAGESFEDAVRREMKEEVNLDVRVGEYICTYEYSHGECKIFLADIVGSVVPKLGYDPELPLDKQALQEVKWWPIDEMKDDYEVSMVLKAVDGSISRK